MSKINIKATVVANQNKATTVANRTKTPVCTRVQIGNNEYRFINSLEEARELISTSKYSIFVNYLRGKNNTAPFKKGHLCSSYKEAIEYIASAEAGASYRVDLVLRNATYSSEELAAIAANLDF